MLAELSSNKKDLSLLLAYCKDINEWPGRWAIDNSDIPIGKSINEYFKLFLIDRIEKNRTKSTIKIYARYLFALGGELIRHINDDNNKMLPSKDIFLKYIDSSGGPFWRHSRDDFTHARYDSVCKQLFKFVVGNSD